VLYDEQMVFRLTANSKESKYSRKKYEDRNKRWEPEMVKDHRLQAVETLAVPGQAERQVFEGTSQREYVPTYTLSNDQSLPFCARFDARRMRFMQPGLNTHRLSHYFKFRPMRD
jgi:hypothetical protein